MEQFLQRNVKTQIPTFGDREHYSFFECWRTADDMSCNPFFGIPTYASPSAGEHLFQEAQPSFYVPKNLPLCSTITALLVTDNQRINGSLPYTFCPGETGIWCNCH